jgi:alkylated DNA repair dioxygenase AlkB
MIRVFGNEDAYLTKYEYENILLLDQCIEEINTKLLSRPEIIIYGKVCHQHRDVGFFSNESIGYKYSNQLMRSQQLTESLQQLLNEMNEIYKSNFNGILINKYNDGHDYISAHSDSEDGLDDDVGVIALSYGEERIFRIRSKKNKQILYDEITTHGSILQMGGFFQTLYTHEIPIQKELTGVRYSFTFRKHIK